MKVDIPPPELPKHNTAVVAPNVDNTMADAQPLQPRKEVDGLDTTVSALRLYSPITQIYDKTFGDNVSEGEWDHEFNPFAEDMGNIPPNVFVNARNKKDFDRIVGRYNSEMGMRAQVQQSGALGIAASVGAGFTDPTMLLPILGWGAKGSSALGFAMKSGLQVGAAATIHEGAIQGGDLLYSQTAKESAFNIAAASIVGGLIGGIAKGASNTGGELASQNEVVKKVIKDLKEVDDFVGPLTKREANKRWRLDAETPQQKGLMKFLGRWTPMSLLSSENKYVRQLAVELGEQGVVETSQAAIESLVKRHRAGLFSGISKMREQHELFSKSGGKMSNDEFQDLVTVALRNGDSSDNPFVSAAAVALRNDVIEPLTKLAQKYGVLDEDLVTKYAQSYFPRMYNRSLIRSNQEGFVEDIATKIAAKEGIPMSQARTGARSVYKAVTGASRLEFRDVYRTQFDLDVGAGVERTVKLADNDLKPWLVNKPDAVLMSWMQEIAPHIELSKRYGSSNLEMATSQINKEFETLSKKAKTAKERTRIEKDKSRSKEQLEALRDRLLNKYGMPDNPDNVWVQNVRAVRNLTTINTLGGMTISSIPDMARPVYYHGLGRYANHLLKSVASKEYRAMSRGETERMGAAVERVLDSRIQAYTQNDWDATLTGSVNVGLEKMSRGFGRVVLMSQFNHMMKGLSGSLSADGFLNKVANPAKFKKQLRMGGVDESMAKRIASEFKTHGKEDRGLKLSNSGEWKDREAAMAFEAAVIRETDSMIITPGILDRPLWMSSETGKFFGQFKSFIFAANNRVLMTNMARADKNVMAGLITSMALGFMTISLKDTLRGKDPSERWKERPDLAMWEVANQTGVLGLAGEMASIALDSAAIMGADTSTFKPQSKDLVTDMMGPSVSKMTEAAKLATTGDLGAARALTPYNNVWYLRWLFDGFEKAYEGDDERNMRGL